MASPPLPSFVSFTRTWHCEPYPFISPQRKELSAAGRNVVITGGGSGIGRATAIAFAQAHAKSVSIIGRRLDRLEAAASVILAEAPSTKVHFEVGDITKRDSIETALRNISDKVGPIDIFISNAGVLPKEGPVLGYDEADLRYGLETMVVGSFNSLQAFMLFAAPGAKVFNVGSGIGHWAPLPEVPGVFSYAAAKAGALRIFDYFAAENPYIHVVSIQPGIIGTEINPKITEGFDTVELPAHFLVWLASEEAKFLRGKFVWANWDAQELLWRSEEIQNSMHLQVTLNGVDM